MQGENIINKFGMRNSEFGIILLRIFVVKCLISVPHRKMFSIITNKRTCFQMIDSLKTGSFMKNGIYAVKSLCDSGR